MDEPAPISRTALTDEERAVYEWQMWVPDFGEAGQEKLKAASVMVSRVGGVGSVVAYELAAAGIGKLVLAHAGNVKPSDLNRQLLMTHDWVGKPRIESIRRRLLELNPRLEIVAVDQNVSESNAAELVEQCDLVVDCAPLFPERFAMNDQAMRQGKPMVECAMYELEAHITTFLPGAIGMFALPLSGIAADMETAVSRLRRGFWNRRVYGGDGSGESPCRNRSAAERPTA